MDISSILSITLPIIVTVLGSVRWMDSKNRQNMKSMEDRHREDIKEVRSDVRRMDEKWERLFEKFLELRR